jgi:predicted nucleic acid-binding protein
VRFWDSSAVVSLVVREASWERLYALLEERDPMIVWWGTPVECASALARLDRSGLAEEGVLSAAYGYLMQLETDWHEIPPSEPVRDGARRLLRRQTLRAADSFQLSAALIAADGAPGSLEFVCLDDRLREAAEREGFPLGP